MGFRGLGHGGLGFGILGLKGRRAKSVRAGVLRILADDPPQVLSIVSTEHAVLEDDLWQLYLRIQISDLGCRATGSGFWA